MKNGGESISKTILTNIKQMRLGKNYTQEFMATRLSISQNASSKIELGYSKLTLERCSEIAEVLETQLMTLMVPAVGPPHPLLFPTRRRNKPKP
jgi:transcriptional regulator with XRE-family HTH domain